MLKENPIQTPDLLEVIRSHSSNFDDVCDSLVDFQVPESLYKNISNAINNENRLVSLVTTHQSYFEIETQRKFCHDLNEISTKPIDTYVFYSAPAVDSNIGEIFRVRQPSYEESRLHLLGIIRPSDRQHPQYCKNITPEIEREHQKNFKTFIHAIKKGGCLIISPLESTLESGRINIETGKIKGLQATTDDENLNRMIKKNALIVPCGIDGSYKILDPNNHHLPTKELISAFYGLTNRKVVTFKANQIIDTKNYINQEVKQICRQIIIEVAKLVSPDARGKYKQFI